MGYFLALDAGGTKTECWLADDERVLAKVSGRTVKLMSVGAEEATTRLRELVQRAALAADVPLNAITRTCMGLAGIKTAGVRAWAEETLGGLVSGEVLIVGDEVIALQAAFGDGPGVLVIAGTGSNIIGRCSDGTRTSAGGWGPVLGDEGSGHWIGLEAIRSSLRALDRGESTGLLGEICSAWEVDGLGGLNAKASRSPRPDFAVLAEVVADCAERGDAVAVSVLQRAGEDLASQVGLVFSKMLAAGCPPEDVRRVAFTGSVLGRIGRVREAMRAVLLRVHPEAEIADEPVQSLEGALALARRG